MPNTFCGASITTDCKGGNTVLKNDYILPEIQFSSKITAPLPPPWKIFIEPGIVVRTAALLLRSMQYYYGLNININVTGVGFLLENRQKRQFFNIEIIFGRSWWRFLNIQSELDLDTNADFLNQK